MAMPSCPPRTAPRATLAATLIAASLLVSACAGTPPPNDQLAVSNAAISSAAAAGGAQFAPAEMMSARDKMERARVALADEKHDLARTLAQAAQVDAQLAEARANAARATLAAEALQEGNRVLRDELQRKSR